MTFTSGASEPGLADEIAAYLLEHTDAEDTLEGIAEWWLLEQQIVRQVARVRAALDVLGDRGWIHQRRGRDGREYYRVNPDKLDEIRRRLGPPAAWTDPIKPN